MDRLKDNNCSDAGTGDSLATIGEPGDRTDNDKYDDNITGQCNDYVTAGVFSPLFQGTK